MIYYEMYMVLEPADSGLKPFDLVEEEEYIELESKFGFSAVDDERRDNEDYFYAAMGGEAIKEMLSRINIMELKKELEDIVKTSKVQAKKNGCFEEA